MEYDFTNEINNGSVNTDPKDNCYGIHWSIGMVNTVKLDLSDIDQGTYTLEEWDAPVFASGCIGESLSIAAPTATVTAVPSGGTTSGPPPAQDCSSLTCPNDNGAYCVASNGLSFQINCNSVYDNSVEQLIRVNSDSDCVNACAADSGCIGITWFPIADGGWLGNGLPNCLMFSSGAFFSSDQGSQTVFSFTKVTSSQKKRSGIVERATTVATSSAAAGTASSKVIIADTLSLTASATTTTTATTTGVSTDVAATSTAVSSHDMGPITITDATGQLLINPHVNGSLFVSPANSSVSMTSLTNDTTFMADLTTPLVVGDSASRILYYFPSTISAVGASRLRLATWDAIPIGAEMIMLFPTVTNVGTTVLVAMDSTQNVFFPFVCSIEGQLNKIFLVSDAPTGASTLMDPDLTYTVIGGVAQSCVSLAMVAEHLPGWTPPSSAQPTD